MSRSTLPFIFLLLGSIPTLSTAETAFRQITLDPQGNRPLEVALWYPTEDRGTAETVGENAAFFGIPVLRDAAPEAGDHPLVLLSHGYGGSWRNLNWLAERLVDAGYVVAAPDHPGTTTFNRDPEQAAALFERPHDLSRATDALLANPALAGLVDANRIAAIGHSLGGWTVAALAGARFAPDQFAADCARNPNPRTCSLSEELGLNDPAIESVMPDPRLGAFVSLDLGLARGFTPESLSAIDTPALIIGAGVDIGDLPAKLESGWLAEHLPADSARLWMIPDAMHFSFMHICKPGAEAMIEEEDPGDGIVCRDGGTRSRQDIHAELANEILAFLGQNLTVR
ncbi:MULTISPECIES: alpha/beta hydrolase family protein [unclassified Yoonia]|uniref:alpha/beta hydrolase family protein n=1 Tax=unclassified Yoonia TaxID=2629118 RepID=UPI002AFF07A9|nr:MULTISPECIES: alpha/beta fold hydrolase [unclassified Yoonia]